MKRLSFKEKQYNIKHSEKKHAYELDRKKVRKEKRYQRVLKKIEEGNPRLIKKSQGIEEITCLAPTTFSLLNDPISVISYFEKIEKLLKKGIPVFFNLSNVNVMGLETLMYLCALIKDENITHGTPFRGNVPNVLSIKEMFKRSGFYDNVISGFSSNIEYRDPNDRFINWKSEKKVEGKLAGNVCSSAMKHTFKIEGFDKRVQNYYKMLIECMANTTNHASSETGKSYNWWIIAYKDFPTMVTKFCFLDLGVGIFGSLENRYKKNTLEKCFSWFKPNNHKKTLEMIFKGNRRTSTVNLEDRGLGLINIYKFVKGNRNINNFTMLSNDIMAKIGYNTPDDIEYIDKDFNGTIYYWELVPN